MKAVDNLEVAASELVAAIATIKAAAPNLEGELATTIQRRCENIMEQLGVVVGYVKNTAVRVGASNGN